MVETGIIGASGYTGGELLRLLSRHNAFEVTWATSRRHAGRDVSEVFPYLRDFASLAMVEPDLDRMPPGLKAVLVALPHTEAMELVPVLLEKGVKVVDLSADFRLDDPMIYAEWYGRSHQSPNLIGEAVYGLTEWCRDSLGSCRLVANPGCYPTAALLALLPLLKRRLVAEGEIVVDAKSGLSGAGRSPKQETLFCEANENVSAYSAARHRHIPEMEQELRKVAGKNVALTFTPHLVPLSRGMLATIYLRLEPGAGLKDVGEAYRESYAEAAFVKISPSGVLPSMREVAGTNVCRIGYIDDPRGGRIIVVSVLDNLLKGASGQAVQNLNLMFGIPEKSGLEATGLFP